VKIVEQINNQPLNFQVNISGCTEEEKKELIQAIYKHIANHIAPQMSIKKFLAAVGTDQGYTSKHLPQKCFHR
jgi:hypothetical protein